MIKGSETFISLRGVHLSNALHDFTEMIVTNHISTQSAAGPFPFFEFGVFDYVMAQFAPAKKKIISYKFNCLIRDAEFIIVNAISCVFVLDKAIEFNSS